MINGCTNALDNGKVLELIRIDTSRMNGNSATKYILSWQELYENEMP